MTKTFPAGQINIAPRQVLFVLLFLESVVIAIAIGKAITRDLLPAHYFGENGLVTDASCIQLAIASMLALATFWSVKHSHNSRLTKNGWFWLVVSCGLVFLAFDDAYEIHEHLDTLAASSVANSANGSYRFSRRFNCWRIFTSVSNLRCPKMAIAPDLQAIFYLFQDWIWVERLDGNTRYGG